MSNDLPPVRPGTPPAQPPVQRKPSAPPAPQAPPPAAPPKMPSDPLVDAVRSHPLLQEPFRLLQGVAVPERVMADFADKLKDLSTEQVAGAYQTARAALTKVMYDQKSDPDVRTALNHLVTVTMGALRERGLDPLQMRPSEVSFPPTR